MNQRIAKKIDDFYGSGRYWSRYTVQQRDRAALVDGRRMMRRAAAVRAKHGWGPSRPIGIALTSAKTGETVWVRLGG